MVDVEPEPVQLDAFVATALVVGLGAVPTGARVALGLLEAGRPLDGDAAAATT
jgi:hypothetical protein